jgi:hypothetical protein
MSKFGKVFSVIVAIVAVVGIGLGIGWWASSRSSSNSGQGPNSNSNELASATPAPVTPVRPSENSHKTVTDRSNAVVPMPKPPIAPTNAPGLPGWEEKVDAILTADIPDNEKAKKMLELFPQLAPDAQEEVAHHLSNLVPDEEYAPLGNYLTNAAMPEAVLDVLLEDVFNRPNSVKLPLLLDIARNPQHPKATESRDVLELFLEEDYGNDWSKWQARMDQWLKENPD